MPDKHEVGGSTPLEPTTANTVGVALSQAKVTVLRLIVISFVGRKKNVH